MNYLKEYLDKFFNLILKRFDNIDSKLEKLSQEKISEESDFLDNEGVQRLLNISERTLQRYKQHKLLPYAQIKGKSYYRKSDVYEILNTKLNK